MNALNALGGFASGTLGFVWEGTVRLLNWRPLRKKEFIPIMKKEEFPSRQLGAGWRSAGAKGAPSQESKMAFAGGANASLVALEFREESEAQECSAAFAEAFPGYRFYKPAAGTIIIKSSAADKLAALAKDRGAQFKQSPVRLAGDLQKDERSGHRGIRPDSPLATREGLIKALAEVEKTKS